MKAIKITMLTLVSVLMLNCGGEAKKEEKKQVQIKNNAPTGNTKAVEGTVLSIQGNDLMQFNKTELRAKAGQKVTLTLRHTGKMGKEIMGHNFVLLKQGTSIVEYANKAVDARENDYIPEGDAAIAHTKMLGGGETDTIVFDAPAPGTYDFICSFPGHMAMMKGKFIVE